MAKPIKLTFLFIIITFTSFGQTYVGKNLDGDRGYGVVFGINKDSTVIYAYTDDGCCYAEHTGKLSKVNDTLFHAEMAMTFGQFCMKDPNPAANFISFKADTIILSYLEEAEVVYSDSTSKRLVSDYSYDFSRKRMGIPKKAGSYSIRFTNRKNLITGKELSFTSAYGTSLNFTHGAKVSLDIVIKDGLLYTIYTPDLQVGHFILKEGE